MTTAIKSYEDKLGKIFEKNKFVVFLCGPSLKLKNRPASILRRKTKLALEKLGIEVYLGEDDGLKHLSVRYGLNAHLNEEQFVKNECQAIVLIADSVGAFCELGLFSYIQPNLRNVDLILLVNKKYKRHKSYLNTGPALAAEHHGKLFYTDFRTFDVSMIIDRLKQRRSVFTVGKK